MTNAGGPSAARTRGALGRRSSVHVHGGPKLICWARKYFREHPHAVRQGVEANYQTFVQNLRDATEHINENHDVAGLCASFLARIDKMVEGKGERLQS